MEQETQTKDSGVGAIVGSVIIILIIIAGAMYLYGSVQERRTPPPATETDMMSEDEYKVLSIEVIEGELETINLADIEAQMNADLNAIEAAF